MRKCVLHDERLNIIMKLGATNVATIIWREVFEQYSSQMMIAHGNHASRAQSGWEQTIKTIEECNYTWYSIFTVFCHWWRSISFTDSRQGSPGAAYTCLDLDLEVRAECPGGVMEMLWLWPYAYISSHYNEDQPVNSEIRGTCCSSVSYICVRRHRDRLL